MYRHLSVEVGEENDDELDTWTVERSLRQFFQPEKRQVKCEKCEDGKTATQRMQIISRPKALLLHFKRFIVTQELEEGELRRDGIGTKEAGLDKKDGGSQKKEKTEEEALERRRVEWENECVRRMAR